jgi:Fuc2NAc and GlcNAc transferase
VIVAFADRVEVVHGMPWIGDLDLAWAAWPLTLFWLACYPNAFNFMDGINGIASVTAAVSSAVFVFAAVSGGRPPRDPALLACALATEVAALGFVPWNFPRARTFMGDVGSLPLGLALAFCAVRANSVGALSFPASVLLLGPFLFDVTFTLVARLRRGERLGQAHREHLYQRLARALGSHTPVTLLYGGFSVVTGVLALSYGGMSDAARLLSLAGPLAAMLTFAVLVRRLEQRSRT